MSHPVDPIAAPDPLRRSRERRGRQRRSPAQPQVAGLCANLPVIVPTSEGSPPVEPQEPAEGATAFTAQLLGQPGQKRGLRGGPETLERARSAYLEAAWRGPRDRRHPRGRVAKEEA